MNNAIVNSKNNYKEIKYNQTSNNIINKTAKKNIKTKNSDININRSYRLNNSSESNLRNQRNNGVICNSF